MKLEILEFFKKNKFCTLLFFISTFLFLYQHLNIGWDFRAYVLNAKYLFYDGTYFETLRSPMVSLFLGFFLLFGKLSEYLYIIFVSCLFFYSSIKLSDVIFKKWTKKFDKYFLRFVFYFFSLGTFTFLYGLNGGSELLALSFFELFLIYFLSNKLSGLFLGLAFLTRYSFLTFFPFLFLNRNFKKIGKNILLFFAIIFPWFLFNRLKFGNWFTSFVDAYANNVFLRDYLFISFNPNELFLVVRWFLPLFLIGLIFCLFKLFSFRSKNWFESNKVYIIFFLLFFIVIWNYLGIPLKQIRYLFNLILPVAFFSTIGLLFLILKFKKIKFFIKLILIFLFLISSLFLFVQFDAQKGINDKYYDAAEDIYNLNISDCLILSPHWVMVTYYTENIYPLFGNRISNSILKDEIILVFYSEHTIDHIFKMEDLSDYPKLYETEEYVFLVKENFDVNSCAKKYVYDQTYVTNHCKILSEKFKSYNLDSFVLKMCKFVN